MGGLGLQTDRQDEVGNDWQVGKDHSRGLIFLDLLCPSSYFWLSASEIYKRGKQERDNKE